MFSSPPPPYPGDEPGSKDTPTNEPSIPQKKPLQSTAPAKPDNPTSFLSPTNPPIEMKPINPQPAQTTSNAPQEYATVPNAPLPMHHQAQAVPIPGQAMQQIVSPPVLSAPQVPCVGAPPTIQPTVAYATSPAVMGGYPTATAPMQQVYPQPAVVPPNAMCMPGAMGTSPGQAGAINLIVNTNTNPNGATPPSRAAAPPPRPAPRSCPKCRMGYITRGQARFRETCIKALAYATICCTCLLPLRLLKTNYVDKCSYCGEEYGFRGELFEKPKPPKK